MEVQVIGHKKCADTHKAERFFKERGIKVHSRDLKQSPLSPGEIKKISGSCGGIDSLIDRTSKEFEKRNLKYISVDWVEALEKYPLITRTPVVRSGGRATIGYQPEKWKEWIEKS